MIQKNYQQAPKKISRTVRRISFDLDGTLISSDKLIYKAIFKTLEREFNIRLSEGNITTIQEYVKTNGPKSLFDKYIAVLTSLYQQGNEEVERLVGNAKEKEISNYVNMDLKDSLTPWHEQSNIEVIKEDEEAIKLFETTPFILESVKTKKQELAERDQKLEVNIITNRALESTLAILEKLGIKEHFDIITCTDGILVRFENGYEFKKELDNPAESPKPGTRMELETQQVLARPFGSTNVLHTGDGNSKGDKAGVDELFARNVEANFYWLKPVDTSKFEKDTEEYNEAVDTNQRFVSMFESRLENVINENLEKEVIVPEIAKWMKPSLK